MKKATLNTIVSILNTIDFNDKPEILAELNTELNRGAEAKAMSFKEYDAARAVVMAELANAESPVTIRELFEAVKDKLPSGFTKGKLQYGVIQLWKDVIDRTEGSPHAYFLR